MNSKERLTRKEVMVIDSPEYTKTWHPISHREVIESMQSVMNMKKIRIVRESYSIKNNGNNMFGSWVTDIENNGKCIQLGFRNSISKTFAVGVCSGTFVIVCSNMQFRGDFIEFRKHTSGITYEELLQLGNRAIDQVVEQGNLTIEWQNNLSNYELEAPKFKQITYDAMERGILAPNHFNQFLSAHKEEVELTKNRSLYEFHGAITRMSRDLNLFTIDGRTRGLADLCNQYMN